jgi:hypothetical protein
MPSMRILSLDLAEYKVGWALGESGTIPRVQTYKLRVKDERTEEAVERFAKWLQECLVCVDLLAVEHYLPSGAMKGHTTADTRDGAIMLNAAARAVASICNVPFRSPYPATIRKHFIGRASMGDSASTKAAVIRQAQLLGYLSKDCFDDNMADAAALFDFASSHFANKAAAFQLA